MNSTRGAGAVLLGWIMALCFAAHAQAADTTMPRPPELEPDVQFWIRVYTQVDTNGGFIHDADNLAVVYDTLRFDAGASPRDRQKIVERDEDSVSAALRTAAHSPAKTRKSAICGEPRSRRPGCVTLPTMCASSSARRIASVRA